MEEIIDEFCIYFYKKFGTHATWYLHFFWIHLPQYIKFWYPIIKVGYGIFTTQGSEHQNKFIKKGIFHTKQQNNYLQRVLQKMYWKKNYFYSDSTHKRKFKCSACNGEGHQRNNQQCPMYKNKNQVVYFILLLKIIRKIMKNYVCYQIMNICILLMMMILMVMWTLMT